MHINKWTKAIRAQFPVGTRIAIHNCFYWESMDPRWVVCYHLWFTRVGEPSKDLGQDRIAVFDAASDKITRDWSVPERKDMELE